MNRTESIIDTRSQFGSRVRELRREQHLTQVQLGTIVGLSRSQISRLERGRCNTTLDTILLIAHGLGVQPTDLFNSVPTAVPMSEGNLPITLSLPVQHETHYHATEL